MKNLLTAFILTVICSFAAQDTFAQCTPIDTFTQPGLYPAAADFPCVSRNLWQQYTIQFKNYSTFNLNGNPITIDSVRVDTVGNLPAGFIWSSSNRARNNTFTGGESGCLLVWGQTTDPAGQYRLNIAVTAYVGGTGLAYNAAGLGLRYDVRVVDSATATCPTYDTAAVSAISSANGGKGTNNGLASTYTGIYQVDNSVIGISNYPNPFNGTTEVTFTAAAEKEMTFRVYNVLGQTMHAETFVSTNGKNTITFNSKNLESGVYFYSVSDGSKTSTNRMVITK